MNLRENKWKYLFIKRTLIQFATQEFFFFIFITLLRGTILYIGMSGSLKIVRGDVTQVSHAHLRKKTEQVDNFVPYGYTLKAFNY